MRTQKGFTLIEVIISIALFVVLAYGMIQLSSIVLTTAKKQGGLLADSDEARRVAFQIISELRNAVSSSVGAYALENASAQTITFYSNVDGGTDIERVRYYISSGSLYKGVIKPTGSPLSYVPANEKTWIVQKYIGNGANTLFYYYNDSYNGVTDTPLTPPVNVTQVRYIKIRMQIVNKAGVKNTTVYNVNAGGAIRGLKDNLAD